MIGAMADHKRACALAEIWGSGAHNLCGGPRPRVAAALLRHARLFIGHDSGPLHLAQAMGTPAIGLFGFHNKPKQWHPIGPHISVIHEMRGIEYITVNQVFHKVIEFAPEIQL